MAAPSFTRYQRLPGLVLGFHGCDAKVGEDLLVGRITQLNDSKNEYDWLGIGVYFWENDPQRALEFAQTGHAKTPNAKGYIAVPFVLGAVIDLGLCLNLTDRRALDELARAHLLLSKIYDNSGEPMPVNKGNNLGARYLDRASVEMVHGLRLLLDAEHDDSLPPYDTVRCPFPEGEFLYAGSAFRAQNHIQIAVRNKGCIKGYFRPIPD